MESSKVGTVEIEVEDVRYVGTYAILPGRFVEVRTPFASKSSPTDGTAPAVVAKQLLYELVGTRRSARTSCGCTGTLCQRSETRRGLNVRCS
jgi:hypothetical protein